ncbi:MAG: class I SAM-dependent methyltransferase [Planctomycetes bacterium]|nr:class I SAM-dependent methyltransferase [Planctomycetota bacterium]
MLEQKNSEYENKYKYTGIFASKYNERRISEPIWDREQDAFKKCLRSLPDKTTIIDIPIGTGRFIEFYKELGFKAQGVDISKDMLREAQKTAEKASYHMEYIHGDALNLPQNESECDYVVCARLLNWVPFHVLVSMLKEFMRVSKKGMILQIRVGTPLSIKEYFKNMVYRLLKKPGTIFKPIFRRIFFGKPVDFFIHNKSAVENLFMEYGVSIADEKIVDKAIKLGPKLHSQSIIYVLNLTTD